MILTNLKVLLAERGLTISKVSSDTTISRTTLTALANNTGAGIQFETLDKLCQYLGVDPSLFFIFYNGDLTIQSQHSHENCFFLSIKFHKKEANLFCEIDDFDISLVDLSFYMDSLKNVDDSVYLKTLIINISSDEPDDTLDIKKVPLPIKKIIETKIYEIAFSYLLVNNNNLVHNDKTKLIINWL